MSKAKKDDAIDPSLPFTVVTIRGKEYKLCMNFRAMAIGERKLNQAGVQFTFFDEIRNWRQMDIATNIFAASLSAFQPDMPFAQAAALVDYDSWPEVQAGLADAISQAFPDPDPPAPAL